MTEHLLVSALDDTERAIYDLIGALRSAQAHHRFYDPDAPRFEIDPEMISNDPASFDRAVAKHTEAMRDHLSGSKALKPREPLALALLWDELCTDVSRLANHRVPDIKPVRRESDDLYFNTFAVSQRRIAEQRSPKGWLPRSYFVGVPTGETALRCVVLEATGRCFCTVDRLRHCDVPRDDDFGVIRVSGTGANYKTGERGPVVMSLYLPAAYGEWRRIVGSWGDGHDEQIVGYGENGSS